MRGRAVMPRFVDLHELAERYHEMANSLTDPHDREIVHQYAHELEERCRRREREANRKRDH
jgi:hypothetical protein